MSPIKRPIWTAHPLLVAYVVVVGATIGLLINRNPDPGEAVPAVASTGHHATMAEGEAQEPPLWLQLFRPSPPTARLLLRTALPSLPFKGNAAGQEARNLLILWTGRAGERPQTLFQAMLPFLRPRNQAAAEPKAPVRPAPGTPGSVSGGSGAAPPGGSGSASGRPGTAGPGAAGQTQQPSQGGQPGPSQTAPPPKQAGNGGTQTGAEPAGSAALNGGLPLVGIYHTHDWESYISEFPGLKVEHERDLIKVSSYDHSKRTIVDIGETLAYHLRDLGVTTVHAPFSHQDVPYDYAYQSSRETAQLILKKAPSVKILLDLHRDGTFGLDSTTVIAGKPVARIRCVIGTREDQTHWERNRAFCDDLIARLERAHPGLTLPTLTKEYRFNQDLLPGAILLEIGNATNQYAEAERAVQILAKVLVAMIKEGAYPH